MRCKDCGDVRWSFIGFRRHEPVRCILCGGLMVAERRHPHRHPDDLDDERREIGSSDAAPGPDRPAAPSV